MHVKISPTWGYALSQFISFPYLLKAMIKAKRKKAYSVRGCNINEVIIPENYKTCISCDEYKSSQDLPEKLRIAIDKRYAEQSRQ